MPARKAPRMQLKSFFKHIPHPMPAIPPQLVAKPSIKLKKLREEVRIIHSDCCDVIEELIEKEQDESGESYLFLPSVISIPTPLAEKPSRELRSLRSEAFDMICDVEECVAHLGDLEKEGAAPRGEIVDLTGDD